MTIFEVVFGVVILLVTALFLFSRSHARLAEAKYPPRGTFIAQAGRRWHVLTSRQDQGSEGRDIILLHGASSSAHDLSRPLMPHLAPLGRVIAPDRPGHGYSSRTKGDDTPEVQARAIWALLDHLDVKNPILIGHSWGGALMMAMALERPQAVRGLIGIAPVMRPWDGEVEWIYHLSAKPVIGQIFVNTLITPFGLGALDKAVEKVFAPAPVPEKYRLESGSPLSLRPYAFKANGEDMAGLNRAVGRLSRHYDRLTMPIHIIGGAGDTILKAKFHTELVARLAPQTTLDDIEDEGHMPHYRYPHKVAEAVRQLL